MLGGGDGLIPAHAGSTWKFRTVDWLGGAHPRSRGEHTGQSSSMSPSGGSSPLTRGAQTMIHPQTDRHGLIPAHAGSTLTSVDWHKIMRAHPRSRGEHLNKGLNVRCAQGSSPLTRGALRALGLPQPGIRLIPAHAGSTRRRATCSPKSSAHPRSRGEHRSVS